MGPEVATRFAAPATVAFAFVALAAAVGFRWYRRRRLVWRDLANELSLLRDRCALLEDERYRLRSEIRTLRERLGEPVEERHPGRVSRPARRGATADVTVLITSVAAAEVGRAGWRRKASAGVLDSGLSSLATFLVGIYAARVMSADDLGLYGLFFAGFVFVGVVPTQLVFVPTEVMLLPHDPARQLASVRRSLWLGAVPATVAAVAMCAVVAVAAPSPDPDVLLALVVTAGLTTVLSPVQDHLRRLLHQNGRSSSAATMSAVQLAATVAVVVAARVADAPAAWVPFGALLVGKTVSLFVGLTLRGGDARRAERVVISALDVVKFGHWLVYAAVVGAGSTFAASLLVAALAGSDAMGHVEASRVLSQPLYVLATGLAAVVGPAVMRAAQTRDRRRGGRLTVAFGGALAVAAMGLILTVGVAWPGSPLPDLFPNAYHVEGLLAATIATSVVGYATIIMQSQLVADQRGTSLLWINVSMGTVQVAVAAAIASRLGAWAAPISNLVYNVAVVGAYLVMLRVLYASPARTETEAESEPEPEPEPVGRSSAEAPGAETALAAVAAAPKRRRFGGTAPRLVRGGSD